MNDVSTFIFDSYEFNPLKAQIILRYGFDDGTEFEEELTLPDTNFTNTSPEILENLLFNLHLIGGISYYKAACPKNIEIKSGTLSPAQAEFWNKLYTQGLGEFFYTNDLDFRGLIQFPFEKNYAPIAQPASKTGRVLLPFGGGKDSYVSFKKLENEDREFTTFVLGEHPQILNFLEKINQKPLIVKRQLSPELFKLNEQGALNGHIPISAYIAFLTIVVAALYDYDEIVLSNEKSANQGNVSMHGIEINHQYSKSFEFEKDFTKYVHDFITPDIRYYSLLRPYSELEIAEQFSKYPEALPLFTSCNRNFRVNGPRPDNLWCCDCPKCAFVFLMLAPFIPRPKLIEVFGKDLLVDSALESTYAELRGEQGIKPFECVGTPEEVKEAFALLPSHQS
jgi:UDP-N-acetyl-alpha-D-muramoyl-L-alanyl-L-glutamate epimerase